MALNEVGTIGVRGDTRGIKRITRGLREMVRGSEKAEKSAGRLGKTVGRLAAGISVGLFARKVIENTKEQERAIAQLNATLEATGRYSDQVSRQLRDQAAALQQLTTFGDETIISAQSQLLTFKQLGGDIIPRATKVSLDFAAKMGVDVKNAVVQFGRALDDPITNLTLLTRQGIAFSDAEKDLIRELQETGRLAEAQAIVLEKLEGKFAGSAEAARNTFGGALQAVSNAFNDLLEGDEGTVSGATAALNDLEKTLQDPNLADGFQKLISAVTLSTEWFAKAAAGVANFGTELGEFFAQLAGAGPTGSLDAINARIEELQYNLDLPVAGGFFRSVAEALGYDIEAARREAEAELKKLLELRRYYETEGAGGSDARARAEAPIEFPESPDPAGILVPIEPDLTKVRERIAELQTELNRDLRKAGLEAGAALSEAVAESSAEVGGPAAEANLRYAQTLQEIEQWERDLTAAKQLTLEKEQLLTKARENAAELHAREMEQIEERIRKEQERLTPAEQLIATLETELELMKLGANEREREIVSRQLAGEATEDQIEKIDELILKRQEAQRGIEALDEFRGATKDLLVDFADGTKSMGDAFDEFAARLRRRALELIAEKLIEQIFGAFGTAGGGQAGGGWASIVGSIFGGGRHGGGEVYPGRLHPVNEFGTEVLSVRGTNRDYLLGPPEGGTITPANRVQTTNNRSTTVNITVPETTPTKTIEQAAKAFADVQRRAEARNG